MRHVALTLSLFLVLTTTSALSAQVTTATLYGVVRDSTASSLPGALVSVVNQGTGLSREAVTDVSGEFALTALPSGRYTLRIELQGFKTFTNDSLELLAGQTVRQTFTIEVGQVEETITVSERSPLVETVSAAQKESMLANEVRTLPLSRRNITGLLTLSTGVTEAATGIAGGGNIRLNGVAEGGTAITVDGTDATANNETRGLNSYGAQNQISVMSIEAVAEVQVVKGILPAEYGGVVGGQVNMLTRSGTNQFHGSLFENWQDESILARDPFLPADPAQTRCTLQSVRRHAGRCRRAQPRVLLRGLRGLSRNVRRHREWHRSYTATAGPHPGRAPDARDGRRHGRDAATQRTDQRGHRPLPRGTAAHAPATTRGSPRRT